MTPEEKLARIDLIESKIRVFAEHMRERLLSNMHKGDWREDQPLALVLKIGIELANLQRHFLRPDVGGNLSLLNYAVNIANYCMILLDILVPTALEERD